MLLRICFIFAVVHGQLSVNELFSFNSKYTLTGSCNDFKYTFNNLRLYSNNYNQLIFNCTSSSLIFQNQEHASSLICPNDENHSQNFRIHFQQLSQTSIQVNQLRLHGIELCSLDDLIRNVYHEYAYYRSRMALLINLDTHNNNKQEQQHLAIATNGEMTFILFLLSSEYNATLIENEIKLILPNENIFKFNQSLVNIWRIDQGYIRYPISLENSFVYQLSKSEFTLFNNETFFVYGTQISFPRRYRVLIDGILATCKYDYILQCTFPILSLNVHDTHEPLLNIVYNGYSMFNTTLKLIPRTRLHQIPTNHSLTDIETFEVRIAANLCIDASLKSLFTFIIHLWKEDVNGTARYEKFDKNNMLLIPCNATAKIGQKINEHVNSISIDDIISMDVDLIHEWYDHRNCGTEQTRISFI
ncbi:unnamed protein product [Adineta steineri]|uniref:Uncharacterized protein n=1 Tax=Adineta steineri TaxID=433720 RepID=A0A818TVX9_9BILA|nr:unnamed protein product [Adineta steineri]